MNLDDFVQKWDSTPSLSGTYQRIDSEHLLDIYVGKDNSSLKHLLLVSDVEPSKIKSSKLIEIEKGKRQDGKWATKFMLLNQEEDSVFINLCFDLIEYSRIGNTISEALNLLSIRFIRWQKLLEKGGGILPSEVIRGLIGEIIFMKDYLSKMMNWNDIISAWLGIEKADKDFVFYDTWAEIKTVRPSKDFITISSIEQLTSEIEGKLVVVVLDNTSPSDNKGFTLNGLIKEMRDILKSNLNALCEFETKLVEIGYTEHKDYDDNCFVVDQVRMFKVTDNFPILRKDNIPQGILNARYDISLTAISCFEIK